MRKKSTRQTLRAAPMTPDKATVADVDGHRARGWPHFGVFAQL